MATKEQIELVKANTAGNSATSITDEQISALLDAHGSVSYVSYKICLLRSSNDAVSIGPISLKGNEDYWKRMAQLYLDEYNKEKADAELEAFGGSTFFLTRADGT